MKSHEVLKQSVEDVGVKTIASDLGVSPLFFTSGANREKNQLTVVQPIHLTALPKFSKRLETNKLFHGSVKKQTDFIAPTRPLFKIQPKTYSLTHRN